MSSSQTYSPFRSVLLREWRRMTSRRLYFGVCIIPDEWVKGDDGGLVMRNRNVDLLK